MSPLSPYELNALFVAGVFAIAAIVGTLGAVAQALRERWLAGRRSVPEAAGD